MQACKAAIGHPGAGPYTTKVMIAGVPFSRLELHFLDVGHPEYKSLADQFTSKWLHAKPKAGVKVVNIIKIEVRSAAICGTWYPRQLVYRNVKTSHRLSR